VSARLAAARLLLARAAPSRERTLELWQSLGHELCHAELGAPLGRLTVTRHEAARFAGLLLAAGQARALRERWDEDWLDHPQARDELRERAGRPATYVLSGAALSGGLEALLTLTAP
jgi:hypothetical protein